MSNYESLAMVVSVAVSLALMALISVGSTPLGREQLRRQARAWVAYLSPRRRARRRRY